MINTSINLFTSSKVDNRKLSVVQKYSYHDRDSIVFMLPKEYQVETIPRAKTISTEYGNYSSTVTVKDDRAVYIRELTINKAEWPKENYPSMVEFYSNIVSNDRARLVLKEQAQ